MENRIEKIKKMQKEKDVVILAHYYVDGAVQEIADYVGDSFYLHRLHSRIFYSAVYPLWERVLKS